MIVDAHVHVSAAPYGNIQTLLAQLEQAGIDRAVCVPGGMVDVSQFSRYLTGQRQPDPVIPNHLVYEALQKHPDRFWGFVCVNPHEDDACLRMMEDGFRHGCRGVKFAPLVHKTRFNLPAVDQVALACGELGFPVYTHVMPFPGATTGDYAALAKRFPKTSFILGHMGFGPGDADAIDLAAQTDNLYLETSLGSWLLVQAALEKLGSSKLIFGSEFPLSHPKIELEKVRLLPASAHPAMLSGNVHRLLGIEEPGP